jgi:hypothetical protein
MCQAINSFKPYHKCGIAIFLVFTGEETESKLNLMKSYVTTKVIQSVN